MIKTKRLPYKAIIIPIILIVIAAGLAIYYFVYRNSNTVQQGTRPTNAVNYGPSKPIDNASNEQRKSNPSNAAQTLDQGSSKQSNPAGIGVTVTQAYTNGSNLVVDTQVTGATSGNCTLTVSQEGQQSVTQTGTVSLPPHANYYACSIFSIPLSQFPNRGAWNVAVTVTSGSSTTSSSWSQNPVSLST